MNDLPEALLLTLYAQTDTREDFAEWFVQQAVEKGQVIDVQTVHQHLVSLYKGKFITGQRVSGRAGVSHPQLIARGVRAAADL
ncbi:hypothetical protein [Deinococcus hopiensis]|uniref:Uncharacterized protein n=1 Tax=Deinococcus hopiensis KR-140 TaxID=695939 RepID=A0A1W1UEE1_9DEIO|nr:hypothetical protein [Deinococcus hopiensis]SMB79154.1 hypothetical protein SAMN00790413_05799 [Deinococcus hopiensis KR-140]